MDEHFTLGQKMWAEGIGTFFLVFVGAGTAAMTLILNHGAPRYTKSDIGIGALGGSADWLAIGLAFAFAIMTMVYIFGHVSGAHINPAVTLSILIQRLISPMEAVAYWVAQLIGATLGAFAIALVYGHSAWAIGGLGAPGPFPGIPLWQAGAAEAIGTFGLVLGVLGLAVNKHAPPHWAGLIIGLNIAGLIILLGNVSGAAINPARTIGPIFADWVLGGPNLWHIVVVYIIAQLLGAAAAAWVYPLIAEARTTLKRQSEVTRKQA
ncbi:MAG: aquaporin family protein [Firmicutes bacterium]|uniref:Aquaporin n=1 Tax=Sulfobacillus benefaciens TaxID=453960 RepID=A0A2T2X5B7_9FIRM|nr:aquaporin family protein [Bacillota bacterium]MCL5012906.1 aquaporin family protein [Bacillota bacterium]PSR29682.1 MAG: aquaporin [Sulfobacillus benefaciens]